MIGLEVLTATLTGVPDIIQITGGLECTDSFNTKILSFNNERYI